MFNQEQHCNERHQCKVCGASFKRRIYLEMVHMAKHHPTTDMVSPSQGLCLLTFIFIFFMLLSHILSIHSVKMFQGGVQWCPKTYSLVYVVQAIFHLVIRGVRILQVRNVPLFFWVNVITCSWISGLLLHLHYHAYTVKYLYSTTNY